MARTFADLTGILTRLREAGLIAKPDKCHIGNTECHYLGHVVGNRRVKPEQAKVDTVENFKTPRKKKKFFPQFGRTL